MQCKCGEETRIGTHEVKTLAGAMGWFDDVFDTDLPLTIEQDKCPACGRMHYEVYDCGGKLLKQQG